MAKPPSSLPPTSTAPLKVTLLLGSFVHSPAKIDLFDLYLPPSHLPAQHPDEASFHVLPTIEHTFRPEQKVPPQFISAAFAGIVFLPWVLLLALVRSFFQVIHSSTNPHRTISGSKSPQAHPVYSRPPSSHSPHCSQHSNYSYSGTGSSSNLGRCYCMERYWACLPCLRVNRLWLPWEMLGSEGSRSICMIWLNTKMLLIPVHERFDIYDLALYHLTGFFSNAI